MVSDAEAAKNKSVQQAEGAESVKPEGDLQFHSGRLSRESPLSKVEAYGVESPSSKGHDQDTSMNFEE